MKIKLLALLVATALPFAVLMFSSVLLVLLCQIIIRASNEKKPYY